MGDALYPLIGFIDFRVPQAGWLTRSQVFYLGGETE